MLFYDWMKEEPAHGSSNMFLDEILHTTTFSKCNFILPKTVTVTGPLSSLWRRACQQLIASRLLCVLQQKQHGGRVLQTLCCATVRLQSSGDRHSHRLFSPGAGSPRRLDPKALPLSQLLLATTALTPPHRTQPLPPDCRHSLKVMIFPASSSSDMIIS